MLTWLYLSSYGLLLGAELNSELEKQTAVDTTEGPARPLGQRGAWAADHVVDGEEPKPEPSEKPDAFLLPAIAVAQAGGQGMRFFGGPKIGLFASIAATAGLATIKRRGSPAIAFGLLGASIAITWLGRDAARSKTRPTKIMHGPAS